MIRQAVLIPLALAIWLALSGPGILGSDRAHGAMPAGGVDRVLVVGRDGWVYEAGGDQSVLRVGLSDPGAEFGRSAGLMMLVCAGRSHRLHFSLAGSLRHQLRGPVSDGFAHFLVERRGAERPDSVTFYVDFPHATSFRSRHSLTIRDTGSVRRLAELFRSAGRTAQLHLRPRPPQQRFTPDQRLLLIFEPGDGTLPMDEALAAFAEDCARRR